MDIVLWIAAGALAIIFMLTGILKLTQPKEKLAKNMKWVEDFEPWNIRAIAALEVVGALGIIVPLLTGFMLWLVPLAALGLALTMVGAMYTHWRRKETPMMAGNVILLLLALFVAYSSYTGLVA